MDQPVYLRRLIEQKYILIVGVLVALVAGFYAGFSVVDGKVVSRAEKTYAASATLLLMAPQPDYFQVQIPAETETVPVVTDADGNPVQQDLIVTKSEARPINLADSAIIQAYMASSDEIANAVALEIGAFGDGEAITAVRRTTQPNGDERFGGRLELPILEIAGMSTSPERAELIATKATDAFRAMVTLRQREWGVAEDNRLVLNELNAPVAKEVDGSNPAIPSIVVGFGVFLLFIALALIVGSIREYQRKRRSTAARIGGGDDVDDQEDQGGASLTPVPSAAELALRRHANQVAKSDVNEPLVRHE